MEGREGVEPLDCYIALRLGVGSVSGVRPRLFVHHVAVKYFKRGQGRKEKKRKYLGEGHSALVIRLVDVI